MELAALAGQWIVQLTYNAQGQDKPTIKTGGMTLKQDGTGYIVVHGDAPNDQRPVTIATGIDLPPLVKDNIGKVGFNFHQSGGKIIGDWWFAATGAVLYFQSSDSLGTGIAQRAS